MESGGAISIWTEVKMVDKIQTFKEWRDQDCFLASPFILKGKVKSCIRQRQIYDWSQPPLQISVAGVETDLSGAAYVR